MIEITKKQFEQLSFQEGNYFCNGCIFDENTDNLIAFPYYESFTEEPKKYFFIKELEK